MEQDNKRSKRQWEAYIEVNANKISPEVLIKEMMADGYPEEEVKALVAQKKHKAMGSNVWLMVGGVVLVLIGIGFSQASYESVSGSGGTYFVFWGAVVVGICSFFIGLYRLLAKK